MKKIVIIILLSLVLSFSTANSDEKSLLVQFDELEQKLDWLYYRISLEQWDYYTTGKSDSLEYYQNLFDYVLSDKELVKAVSKNNYRFENDIDARRFELIKSIIITDKSGGRNTTSKLQDSLSIIDILFRADFENEKVTAGKVYKIYRTDSNSGRRESAYRAWCAVGEEMQDGLSRLFRMRNRDAKRQGYNNYMALSFNQMDLNFEEYKSLLKRLKTLSEQPYRTILNKAKLNYKQGELEIWDLAYTYSGINNTIDNYFPVDSQMLFIKRSLKDIGFNLDDLPIYYDLESREDKSQLAYGFTIKAPVDMRVLANLNKGLYSTRVLLHEIGHTLHSAFIKQERQIFANVIDGLWMESIAQIFTSMMSEKKWLSEYAHIPDDLIDRYLDAKKEQDIIYLRTSLLRLNFEIEAYKNPNRDLNKLYWSLFEEYLSLAPHDDIYPWASLIYYTTHPVYMQNYLIADIVTAQTREYLISNYDVITKNQNFKSFIVQNYLRFGSRYGWRELLKRGTDSDLSPDVLIKSLGI